MFCGAFYIDKQVTKAVVHKLIGGEERVSGHRPLRE